MKEKLFFETIYNSLNDFYIYGTGMIGKLLYKRAVYFGVEKRCKGFIVSTDSYGSRNCLGKEVFVLDELNNSDIKSDNVILAAMPDLQAIFLNNIEIESLSFSKIINLDATLIEEMRDGYVNSFHNRINNDKENYDVIMMSSDNVYTSGAFLCICDLAKGLQKFGYKLLVVLPHFGMGEEKLIEEKISYVYIKSEANVYEISDGYNLAEWERRKEINYEAINSLRKIIKNKKVKIVHNNTLYTYVGAEAALKERIPYVWHIREEYLLQNKMFFEKKYIIDLIEKAYKIIYVSDYLKQAEKEFDKTKALTIYDGVEIERYQNKRKILENNNIQITMIGYLIDRKGQIELLKAVKLLNAEGINNIRVNLVGDGYEPYVCELKKYIKSNNMHCVNFIGRTTVPQEILWNSDIVVIASWTETFGRVTIEAQSAGCFVIGSDAGATPELIEDGISGLIFPVKNERKLADSIKFVIFNKKKAKEIALEGQRRASYYSLNNNLIKIKNLYDSVISDNKKKV